MFVGKIKRWTMITAVMSVCLHLFGCSDENPQSGSNPAPGQPAPSVGYQQQIALSGGYAERIKIVGGPWQASEPQQEIVLTFAASGLSAVTQFQLDIKCEPALAFDVNGAIFVAEDPFIDPFPNGVILVSPGRIQMGAAILGGAGISGDKTLGTLRIKTSATFGRLVEAQIGVERFSVGPSSVKRDEYTGDMLNLGVVINE